MKKENASSQSRSHPWLDRKLLWRISPAWLIISFLMGVSLLLHLVNIGAIGDGNLYYTAAVKSMLQSWNNFFFAAAEPGGSVTVDKPPLGLWIETLSASIFGVNGFAVSLPNILAGVFSIPTLFHLVKKYFGSLAGITSGAIYTITPSSLLPIETTPSTVCWFLLFCWLPGRSLKQRIQESCGIFLLDRC